MTVIEYAPEEDQILDFINDGIRNLREGGLEAKYILLGPSAYERLIKAMGKRFNRSEGKFETYQFIPIIVDPLRDLEVCVLPGADDTLNTISIQKVNAP